MGIVLLTSEPGFVRADPAAGTREADMPWPRVLPQSGQTGEQTDLRSVCRPGRLRRLSGVPLPWAGWKPTAAVTDRTRVAYRRKMSTNGDQIDNLEAFGHQISSGVPI